jgi:hypothetical protein
VHPDGKRGATINHSDLVEIVETASFDAPRAVSAQGN